ncbi:two-component system sensor histidine kinase NtrB [Frateuria hangzhouensis]|uniref:two-component system sensor histidine kinase NtrB n=1 Tax=Frateuria hangzhouensis TaxID=2995589 RepID=UPI002260E3FB|nr:ATP-binding protein [Frateuria sp. STR12]MCX7513402.1 ATP-binding protein [Frateuria sp. STR12]
MNDIDWRTWAEQATTGLGLVDSELRLAWLNPSLAEALELGPRRAVGQPLPALLDEPGLAAQAARARGGQHAVHWRDLRIHARRLDASLQPLGPEAFLLEVHVLAEPAGSDSPVSASLRGFAHEVKNPLAGLRGAAQLLQRRVGDADLQALAGMVIAEADRLAALADRLLRHGGASQCAPLNIHAVLERVVALLQAEPAPLVIHQDYDPSLPDLRGDADRLQQLLLNLARNAHEAGARALILRTRAEHGVRVGERVLRTAVRLDVVDDGAGVPAELRDTLFEPLVSGRAEGTGLGLALAREIAHEHGGELRHTGAPGATTFTLWLPLESA